LWDQRRARHDGVPALLKEIQERLADLISGHFRSCTGSGWRQQPRPGGRTVPRRSILHGGPTDPGPLPPPAAAGVPSPGISDGGGNRSASTEGPFPPANEDSAEACAAADAQACSLVKFYP